MEKEFCLEGEWHEKRGKLYAFVTRSKHNTNHNYHIQLSKLDKVRWRMSIYLCLVNYKTNDVLILNKEFCAALSTMKQNALYILKEYDMSQKSWEDIEAWKFQHSVPVFLINQKKLTLVGSTYSSSLADRSGNKNFMYYNENKPSYTHNSTYYELHKDNKGFHIRTWDLGVLKNPCIEKFDSDLLEAMLKEIKGVSLYSHLFSI